MKKICVSTLAAVLLFAGAASAEYVKEIKVEGLQRVEKETVLSYLNIAPNTNVSQDKLDAALKNLFATDMFGDVTMQINNDVLTIDVKENPVINKRAFDGNDKISDKILEKEVKLASGSTYSLTKVQEDVQRILQVYKRAGRYSAEVEPKIIERDQNRVDLIFEIDEGPEAKIKKINFIGNKKYSANDLQNVIMSKETRWYRIFGSSETYDPEKMNYDKELLRQFYTKNGFADFRVVSAVAELTPDNKGFVMNFVIDEGPRYKINDVAISTEINDINPKKFYSELEIKKGDWYNADKIEKSVQNINDELGKKGFAFVEVEPKITRDEQNSTINLDFVIHESNRIFVDNINISGNTRTLDKVIRREFRLDEGDAFNAAKIRASRRNIENLNYFSKVDINVNPTDESKADIDVNVEEKSTGYFNVGIGYSTVNGALISAGVTENNFRGRGQQIGVNASVSQRANDYSISFTEPYFMGRRLSAGIDLFRSEEDYQDESSYDTDSTGARVRLGWNYTDDFYQFVRYTISQDQIKNVSSSASRYIKAEEGDYIGSTVGQTLVYDKRDSAINPTEGYYLSFGNDVAGLGGDEKFLRFDAKAYKYYTVFEKYTFKFFFNGGYITAYGNEDVRLAQRYYLGGSTMRGFSFAGIGARDKVTGDALGGNWMIYTGAENLFPIGLDELGIKAKVFYDIGALGKPDNIDSKYVDYSSSPRMSVGFGFQWLSPMGQIDIDFGFPIAKEDYDETEVFRLNFGTRL